MKPVNNKKVGRPSLAKGGLCARDGYTLPPELLKRFRARCFELGYKRSELFREWIEWFLDETDKDLK